MRQKNHNIKIKIYYLDTKSSILVAKVTYIHIQTISWIREVTEVIKNSNTVKGFTVSENFFTHFLIYVEPVRHREAPVSPLINKVGMCCCDSCRQKKSFQMIFILRIVLLQLMRAKIFGRWLYFG